MTDLYLVDSDPNERAKNHYADIAGRAIEQIDEGDRVEYAERVAPEGTLPTPSPTSWPTIRTLPLRPSFSRRSPVLTDDDLTAGTEPLGRAHDRHRGPGDALGERDRGAGPTRQPRSPAHREPKRRGTVLSRRRQRSPGPRGGDKQILASLARRKHEFTPSRCIGCRKSPRRRGPARPFAVQRLLPGPPPGLGTPTRNEAADDGDPQGNRSASTSFSFSPSRIAFSTWLR